MTIIKGKCEKTTINYIKKYNAIEKYIKTIWKTAN